MPDDLSGERRGPDRPSINHKADSDRHSPFILSFQFTLHSIEYSTCFWTVGLKWRKLMRHSASFGGGASGGEGAAALSIIEQLSYSRICCLNCRL